MTERPIETRSFSADEGGAVAVQDGLAGDAPMLVGHAAVFDQWTEINSVAEGRFLERVAPGAFAKTIQENSNRVRVLLEHGHDGRVGNRPLGSVTSLNEDAQGLAYSVQLFSDAPYVAELLPALRSGAYGSSFRFATIREEFDPRPGRSTFNPKGIPQRALQEVRLVEFGPCTFPAYPSATAAVRKEPAMTPELRRELAERKKVLLDIELAERKRVIDSIGPSSSVRGGTKTRGLFLSTNPPKHLRAGRLA